MNWGHKLTIAIAAFVCLMGFMVYKALTTDFQLVEKEYYKSELKYQEVIDGYRHASALSSKVKIQKLENKIVVQLPEEMKNSEIEGTLWFYCAYDETRDRKLPLITDNNAVQELEVGLFSTGRYLVKIAWTSNNKRYYSEQQITI